MNIEIIGTRVQWLDWNNESQRRDKVRWGTYLGLVRHHPRYWDFTFNKQMAHICADGNRSKSRVPADWLFTEKTLESEEVKQTLNDCYGENK